MFITAAGFGKMVTEAFKGIGLRIGNDSTGLLIAGNYWSMWIKEGKITKKAMAKIIELTGIIPEAGEMYLYTKEGNQMEMDGVRPSISDVLCNAINAKTELEDSGLIFDETCRILQSPVTGKIVCISERIFSSIDEREVEEGEEWAEGPYLGEYGGVYWNNNHMAFMVMPVDVNNKNPLIRYLEKININDYRKSEISEAESEEEKEEA